MAIPKFQAILLPLLKFAADKKEHSTRDAINALSQIFGLSDDERKILVSSGQMPLFDNRVTWSRTYLKKAGLIEYTKMSFFRITDSGVNLINQNPPNIDSKLLCQFPGFREFSHRKTSEGDTGEAQCNETERTPQEELETAYKTIRDDLAQDLLKQVKTASPSFFENLVIDLLLKIGYGGSRKEAAKVMGSSGDGGIDGLIKQDPLGLDNVYVQAKRWDNATIGRPEIQKFVGALSGHKTKKGIFITTSKFSKDAEDFANNKGDHNIILIDGERLVQLMIEHGVGVSEGQTYTIKKIDSDYFEE